MISSGTGTHTEEPVINQHVTLPRRLNVMVSHSCKMLKEFMTKVKNLYTPRSRRPRSNWATHVQDAKEDVEVLEMETLESHALLISSLN